MRFQPGAVEFGEVAFEIVGNLKTFDLPCAVFQRQNREMGMAADSIKRKPKGTGIQVCFSGIFSLLLLVAVPAEQDCGIEIFQMGQQKLRMQTEISTEFSGRAVTETKCGKRDSRQVSGMISSCGTKTGISRPDSCIFPIRTPSVGSCSKNSRSCPVRFRNV